MMDISFDSANRLNFSLMRHRLHGKDGGGVKETKSNIIAALFTREIIIAAIAVAAIGVHLLLRYATAASGKTFGFPTPVIPLLFALACGTPLVVGLVVRLFHREFSSDLLAGISIVTSLILGEYLAGTLVVLMLSGGQALEEIGRAHV